MTKEKLQEVASYYNTIPINVVLNSRPELLLPVVLAQLALEFVLWRESGYK